MVIIYPDFYQSYSYYVYYYFGYSSLPLLFCDPQFRTTHKSCFEVMLTQLRLLWPQLSLHPRLSLQFQVPQQCLFLEVGGPCLGGRYNEISTTCG